MDMKNIKNFLKNQIALSIIIAGLLIALGLIGYALINNSSNSNSKNDVLDSLINVDKFFAGKEFKNSEYILGNTENDITIVVYSDFECPFCKMLQENTIQKLQEKYLIDQKDISKGKIGIVYRHFAQSYHDKAPTEINASLCARELYGQNVYANFIDRIYSVSPTNNGLDLSLLPEIGKFAVDTSKSKNQSIKKDFDKNEFVKCFNDKTYNSEFTENMQDAITAGLEGTPYSVILYKEKDNQMIVSKISGMKDVKYFETIIDKLLKIK